jgi:fructose/tagatose bisphosphate aldolase
MLGPIKELFRVGVAGRFAYPAFNTQNKIDTELRIGFVDGLRKYLPGNPEEIAPRRTMKPAIQRVTETEQSKLKEFKAKKLAELMARPHSGS